jgi:hypothetical protein
MADITFYRQQRADGGIRTGIEVNESVVFSEYQPGHHDDDPALLWYVDVRCKGQGLPIDGERARDWLASQRKIVARQLNKLADRIPSGIDPSEWPLQIEHAFIWRNRRVILTIACSAIRRLEARKLAGILREIAENWDQHVTGLAMV